MKLIIGEHEADILYAVGRIEPIEGAQRKIVEIVSEEPLPAEVLEALSEGFRTEDGGYGADYPAYKEVVRHSTWVAETDTNAEVVIQKQAEIAVLNTEKEKLVTETRTMKSAAQSVFKGRKDDILVQLIALMDEWDENGSYEAGDVRKWKGHPYAAIQNSTPSGDMNYSPDKAPALWAVYHAKSFEYALPWVSPTHAEDIYRAGEFMVWTDGAVYECIADTDRAPDVLPEKWLEYDEDGAPVDVREEGVPEGTELNSNGTVKWSPWVNPAGDNSKNYNTGDGVTDSENQRWTSSYGNNGNPPAEGWWVKA